MLSPQQIQYILTLASTKSFSKAANLCFVTQPTLSMQLKKSEELLGFKLFERETTPIELTKAGHAILPLLREIHYDFQKLSTFKAKLDGNFQEEVKIGIIPTVSAYLIPEIYNEWKKKFPAISLKIEEKKTEEILSDIDQKKIDLGILAGPVSNSNILTYPLYNESIKVYSNQHFDQHITAEDLKKYQPWLLTKGNCLRNQMLNFCEVNKENGDLNWDYQGGNLELLIRMVKLYGGYTLVPAYYEKLYAASSFKTNLYTLTTSEGKTPVRTIMAVSPSKNTKLTTLESMIKIIQKKFINTEKNSIEVLNWK